MAKVKEHKEPQPSVIVRRFQFNTRKQYAGESISEYVAVLRKVAEYCNFGDSLNEMLRDRLITETTVQKLLLAEKDLTLDKAMSLAQSVEIAEKGAKDLQTSTGTTTELHKGSHAATPSSKNKSEKAKDKSKPICYRCGGKHLTTKCHFISEEYHSCGKQGHLAKVCRSTKSKKSESSTNKPVHQLREDTPPEAEYTLFPVQSSNCKPLQTTMVVEGHNLTMEVDTGAAVSLVSKETVNSSLFLKCLPL